MKLVHMLDTKIGKHYLIYTNFNQRHEVSFLTMTSAVGYNKSHICKAVVFRNDWNHITDKTTRTANFKEAKNTYINVTLSDDQYIYELTDDEAFGMIAEII